MTAEFVWFWLVLPALAALMIAVIGIAGRQMILGDARHPATRLGVAVAVVVVLAIGGGAVLVNQQGAPWIMERALHVAPP